MLRIVLGVIGGFIAWMVVWLVVEKFLSAIFPAWFGAQQQAFQAVIEHGGQFNPDTAFLLTQVTSAVIVTAISGFLAALIARGNQRAPFILGILLLAMGLLKLVMSWQYVPLWYHIVFTALLFPMAILGGKMKSSIK